MIGIDENIKKGLIHSQIRGVRDKIYGDTNVSSICEIQKLIGG